MQPYSFIYILSMASLVAQRGFPGGSHDKDSTCNGGDRVQSLSQEDSPGEGHGNPSQCSCLENPMDRGPW